MAEFWRKWTDELFLLMFRRGILESLRFYLKVFYFIVNLQSFALEIDEQLLDEIKLYRRDIEPEILPSKPSNIYILDNKIIAQASELMSRISLINKSIEVLHPGNTAQYGQIRAEYGVSLKHFIFRDFVHMH